MKYALELHPDSRCDAVAGVEVDVVRKPPATLAVTYLVSGKIGDLRVPTGVAPARRDELWRHTCFEAFVGAASKNSYAEFNFAPSTEWATYLFSGHREGMTVASQIEPPRIDARSTRDRLELQVSMRLDGIAFLPDDCIWRLALSAVIEETSGRISYWALAHPPGKADFHHRDCFALELAPALRT